MKTKESAENDREKDLLLMMRAKKMIQARCNLETWMITVMNTVKNNSNQIKYHMTLLIEMLHLLLNFKERNWLGRKEIKD